MLRVRALIVAVFSLGTVAVIVTRASSDLRPAVAPLVLAAGAGVVLLAMDRTMDAQRRQDLGIAVWGMRIGFYLMSASSVLGVANTWYAFLDPTRNGWISGLFLIGSAVAAAAFLWLDPSRRASDRVSRRGF